MSQQDTWIEAGVEPSDQLPRDQLTDDERAELGRLLAMRHELAERLSLVDTRMELFVLAVRDHRGLTGKIKVNPHSGAVLGGGEMKGG